MRSERKTLPRYWWRTDFEAGSTLRAREERRRFMQSHGFTDAAKSERNRRRADRVLARWLFEFDPDQLFSPSEEKH